jgi:predicted transcriptional regulator
MGLRKGEYVGVWCPPELKKRLREIAEAEHRSLSQEVIRRLELSVRDEPKREVKVGEK